MDVKISNSAYPTEAIQKRELGELRVTGEAETELEAKNLDATW